VEVVWAVVHVATTSGSGLTPVKRGGCVGGGARRHIGRRINVGNDSDTLC
jgi:hypothetical protein